MEGRWSARGIWTTRAPGARPGRWVDPLRGSARAAARRRRPDSAWR